MKFKMDEKWVVVDETRQKILEAVTQALESKVNPYLPDDTKHLYDLDSKNERKRTNIGARIAGFFEGVIGKHGSTEKLLQKINRDLDHPAWILCDEYRNCLYEKLRVQNRGSKDTESEAISSRFVLICEIVIRFAVIALSREENSQIDGELYIDALEEFCTIIKKQGSLNNFGRLTEFNQFFSTRHDYWIKCLRDAASVVKSIHANKRAIANTLDYLMNVKYQSMRQLVACFELRGIATEDLSDNWISSTFRDCEYRLTGNAEDQPQSNDELALVKQGSLTNNQDMIAQSTDNKERVAALYKLLNETNLLLSIAKQVDMLMNETGWVLILLGAFKPSVLSDMIESHYQRCQGLLNLDEDDPVFATSLGTGLAKYNAASIYRLDRMAKESSANLVALQDPKVLDRMVKLIGGSLGTLISLQDQLNCEFIDKKQLDNVMPALLKQSAETMPSSVTIENIDNQSDEQEKDLKQQNRQLNNQIDKLNDQLETFQQAPDERLDDLHKVKQALNDYAEQLTSMTGRLKTLQSNYQTVRTKKEALQSELSATKKILTQAQASLLQTREKYQATKRMAEQSKINQQENEKSRQRVIKLESALEKAHSDYEHQRAIQDIVSEDLKAYRALGISLDFCKKLAELDAYIQRLENDFNPSQQELAFAEALREQFDLIRAHHRHPDAMKLCHITLQFVKDFTCSTDNQVKALQAYEASYAGLTSSSCVEMFARSVAIVMIAAMGIIAGAVLGVGAGAIMGALGGPGGGAAGALLGLAQGSVTGLGVGLAVGSSMTGIASGAVARHLMFKPSKEMVQTDKVLQQARQLTH